MNKASNVSPSNEVENLNYNGQPVLKFSLQFARQIESMKAKNYK